MITSFEAVSTNRSITAADNGKCFLIDATAGGYTMTLDTPANLGIGFWGFKKTDDTSNPPRLQPAAGHLLEGWEEIYMLSRGDGFIVGCDGSNYWIVANMQFVESLFPRHRTVVVSAGQSPYTVKRTDRHALIRVAADTGPGEIILPPRGSLGFPAGGYRNTFSVGVQNVGQAGYAVTVRPGTGEAIDRQSSITIPAFAGTVMLDYDSNEWFIVGRK